MKEWKDFKPHRVGLLAPGNKNSPAILREAIYLDTETSKIFDEENGVGLAWIYSWAFRFCGETIIGRKPSELISSLCKVEDDLQLGEFTKCVIYVHNLSYDIVYLWQWCQEQWGQFKILATSPRKLISFECGPYIWRCSYRLANRSLRKWGADLGIEHKKIVLEGGYEKVRFQDEELTVNDWEYQERDVIALEECVKKQLEIFGDHLQSVPLTSTGYVRREARSESRRLKARKQFIKERLTSELYIVATRAFAGGLTHGNRHWSGLIYDGLVRHRDFVSCYPSEQICRDDSFPVGRFSLFYSFKKKNPLLFPELDAYIKDHCCLIQIAIKDLQLNPSVTLPYAQYIKFFEGRDVETWKPAVCDNGRILRSYGWSVVCLTELDLKWIRRQYTFDYSIIKVWGAKRGKTPEYLRNCVNRYFLNKSKFKHQVKVLEKEGASDHLIRDAKISLMKSKAFLNSIYGMTAQRPVRCEQIMSPEGVWSTEVLTAELIDEKLDAFYGKRSSFMSYVLGVWTTANSRDSLMTYVADCIGYKHFLYADTDSAFYISTPEVEARIEAENARRRKAAEEKGYYVENNGEKVFYDAFTDEGEDIRQFTFLHAKAYSYVTADQKLHCTIAGVSEYGRDGVNRVQELGDIHNMHSGKTFSKCGGTRSVYLDAPIHTEIIDGHETEVASSCIILNTIKTLSSEIIAEEGLWSSEEVIEND